MLEYYIDVGSSTIKVYKYTDKLKLINEHSIHFKDGFTNKRGISSDNKKELYDYFAELKEKIDLKYETTHIFATGIFRNIDHTKRLELAREFNRRFDLNFTIISHDLENYYLGKAMEHDYGDKKVMIVNMGGKTTELVTFKAGEVISRQNLQIGVADLLNKFPGVNDKYSGVQIETIVAFVKQRIAGAKFDKDYDCAIFTGGEERFEKLTGYNLVPNTIFTDGIHQYMVSFNDFVKGNKKIFYKMTLQELYGLMPQNPKWMDGARAGAILPQAIFEKANIQAIIPSDLNLIDGVIKDSF